MIPEHVIAQAQASFFDVLTKRGISEETARLFEIGLLSPELLVGFFQTAVPDKFLNRRGIIFPVKNLYGDTVSCYFKLPKGQHPKYDSIPFEKNLLFGMDQAYPYILQQGSCILVEGPMDFFALWSHDVRNVCAVLGTNIKREQIHLLRRFTENCFILFDQDPMGITHARKAANDLNQIHMDVTITELPEGYDPDDFIKEYGKNNLLYLLNHGPE
jgi:DNA primase